MDIIKLEAKAKKAREAYYNLDPIISDQEYDALIETIRSFNPNSQEVISVGATPLTSDWGKETHIDPMGSLYKVNSEVEFLEWVPSSIENPELLITHKMDGLSLEIVYENGRLIKTVTRGDGYVGENVTANGRHIQGIPAIHDGSVRIRGEVILPICTYSSKYSSTYANPRNAAAGMLRDRKEGQELCKDLQFIAFWSSENHHTHSQMFTRLQQQGFSVPVSIYTGNKTEIVKYFNESIDVRSSLPYEIDGLVIYINDMKNFLGLGTRDRRPHGAIAWKYAALAKTSKLLDIKWSVGPTGRVNPVAVIEPVNIGGVTIINVSLQNYGNFKGMNLFKGALLLISRKNDVIPYVEGVVD